MTADHSAPALRLSSLDAFRGLTVLAMLVVNSPGNETAYAWLEHSAWNGITPADWIFPFFIFIMGVSLVFSLRWRRDHGESKARILARVFRRCALLFGLGLLLNGFPRYDMGSLRLMGVLQRLGLVYLAGSLVYLAGGWRVWVGVLCGILGGYWAILTQIPVPDFGAGDLSMRGNLPAFIDRLLLAGHLYKPAYDPEGILSTLPAVATLLLGMIAARWINVDLPWRQRVETLLLAGGVLLALGLRWGKSLPLNKALWTSSFVLVTGGLALIGLGLLAWLIEHRGWRTWARPLEVFGVNAIGAYVLPLFLLKTLNRISIPAGMNQGQALNLRLWITGEWLEPFLPAQSASLAFAVLHGALWMLFFSWLYRRNIRIKI